MVVCIRSQNKVTQQDYSVEADLLLLRAQGSVIAISGGVLEPRCCSVKAVASNKLSMMLSAISLRPK